MVVGENYTERSKGKDVRTSNIVAAKAVANAIRTSLGPRGMDKLLQLSNQEVLISNDGATILSKMKVLHPAGKMLVELSQSQDIAAGDGTTTVVVLAGALLEACDELLSKGIHPTMIASSFLRAAEYACQVLKEASRPVDLTDRDALLNAVETCLSSKVVSQNMDVFAPLAVDSVLGLLHDPATDTNVDLRDIRIIHQVGGTVEDSELIARGLVIPKGSNRSAGGGGPVLIHDAKILLIQFCLSAPKTDMDNTVIVQDYAAMDRILREERKYILEQCKIIKKTGCNVLLIQKSILRDAYNELSLHFLAKMGILVVTDIDRSEVDFICRSLHCHPVAHPDQCQVDHLGYAEQVADVWMEGGSNKVVKFTGIPAALQQPPNGHNAADAQLKTMTVVLRGTSHVVLEEAHRSLHDAQCVVRSLVQERFLIAGGGAAEALASYKLQQKSLSLTGQDSYCWSAFAEALTTIPFTLAENAGMKPVPIVTELIAQQALGIHGAGIHIKYGAVADMYQANVVQPLKVSTSAISLAAETVALIMKIDDLIIIQ